MQLNYRYRYLIVEQALAAVVLAFQCTSGQIILQPNCQQTVSSSANY